MIKLFKEYSGVLKFRSISEPALTFSEISERFVGGQLVRAPGLLVSARRLEKVPESEHFLVKRATDKHIAAYRTWRYGRSLSNRDLALYERLRVFGVNRRELYLAVRCGFFNGRGQIKIQNSREWLMFGVALFQIILVVLTSISLFFELMQSGAQLLPSVIAVAFITGILSFLSYPVYVLGIRTRIVVDKIQIHGSSLE